MGIFRRSEENGNKTNNQPPVASTYIQSDQLGTCGCIQWQGVYQKMYYHFLEIVAAIQACPSWCTWVLYDVDVLIHACRVSISSSLLVRSRDLIRQHYSNYSSYNPTLLVIVTWDSVGHYNFSTDLTNTFQAVLVTDGSASFVMFLYSELQWVQSMPKNSPTDIPRYQAFDYHSLNFISCFAMQSNSRICWQQLPLHHPWLRHRTSSISAHSKLKHQHYRTLSLQHNLSKYRYHMVGSTGHL